MLSHFHSCTLYFDNLLVGLFLTIRFPKKNSWKLQIQSYLRISDFCFNNWIALWLNIICFSQNIQTLLWKSLRLVDFFPLVTYCFHLDSWSMYSLSLEFDNFTRIFPIIIILCQVLPKHNFTLPSKYRVSFPHIIGVCIDCDYLTEGRWTPQPKFGFLLRLMVSHIHSKKTGKGLLLTTWGFLGWAGPTPSRSRKGESRGGEWHGALWCLGRGEAGRRVLQS